MVCPLRKPCEGIIIHASAAQWVNETVSDGSCRPEGCGQVHYVNQEEVVAVARREGEGTRDVKLSCGQAVWAFPVPEPTRASARRQVNRVYSWHQLHASSGHFPLSSHFPFLLLLFFLPLSFFSF